MNQYSRYIQTLFSSALAPFGNFTSAAKALKKCVLRIYGQWDTYVFAPIFTFKVLKNRFAKSFPNGNTGPCIKSIGALPRWAVPTTAELSSLQHRVKGVPGFAELHIINTPHQIFSYCYSKVPFNWDPGGRIELYICKGSVFAVAIGYRIRHRPSGGCLCCIVE